MKEKDFEENGVEDIDLPEEAEAVSAPDLNAMNARARFEEAATPVAEPTPRKPATFNPVFWGKIGETEDGDRFSRTYGHYVDGAGTFIKTVDFDKDGKIATTSVVFAPGVALDGFRLKKQK
jgi:hypothetical protein